MTDEQRENLKRLLETHHANCTKEEAFAYLQAKLRTHNKDGTLCKQYGGDYTDEDHPVHSKKEE